MAIRRKKIQTVVTKLLNDNGVAQAPVPVSQIATAQGAKIYVDALEGDLSGFLFRDATRIVIGVNTSHPKTRQQFTIAHELGHLLLHDQEQLHVDRVRLRSSLSSQGTDEAEQEANFFAASLLMPSEFLERDLNGDFCVDVVDDDELLRRLARKYGVSTQALAIRLKTLGYIMQE